MNNVFTLLPKLALNRRFVGDFLNAPAPCGALGVIEERKQEYPLLALRPGVVLPQRITQDGFELGHSVLGNSQYEIVHFAFEFRGFATYHVLVNPSDPVVRAVLRHMVERGNYFVLAIGSDQSVTAFRADAGDANLAGLIEHFPRIERSTIDSQQYDNVLTQVRPQPSPAGEMLEWVCRGNVKYLDLAAERMELTPTASYTELAV